jgi:CIC family chloride channel protein
MNFMRNSNGKETAPPGSPGLFLFAMLSLLVGLVSGLGAVAFRLMIGFFHNVLFLGKISFVYDANMHTPAGPWGALVIFVPVVGSIVVAFLIDNFAQEAKGHGVPEVMDAIYYHKGIIRPVVAAIKSFASAVCIGSGGSVGREGPIVQIGSSFGSTIGQIIPMSVWQRNTLIAAGAGGGIAATFNTPVGAVLFAMELMMHEVNVKTLVPVVISTVMATYIGQVFLGTHPSFVIPALEKPYFHITSPWTLFSYGGLGIVIGAVSAVFIKSIYVFEDFFDKRVKGNYYVRHMTGMLAVGIIMYLLMYNYGHYHIEGVGYATVSDVLSGANSEISFLLLLFALKLFATSLTLGSGGSGGIFSPSLYLGATFGGAYGILLGRLFPGLAIDPAAFAVAGMAGVVGGATGAVMTAIVMIFEMTLDYKVIIPMTLTVALSFGVRKVLSDESIYTLKIARKGHHIPKSMQKNLLYVKRARDIMETGIARLPASATFADCRRIAAETEVDYFLVVEQNSILGVLTRDDLRTALGQHGGSTEVNEIATTDYIEIAERESVLGVFAKINRAKVRFALVKRDEGRDSIESISGLITKQQICDFMAGSMELFSD